MHYIIDANNLAGKLNILFKKDFDIELIKIVKVFFDTKKHRVDLVFDGRDNMGDKFIDGNINVIYTPRDNYYRNADDKIVELVIRNVSGLGHRFIFVVTDDLELIERIGKVSEKIQIIRVSEFAKNIINQFDTEEIEEGLSVDEENEITREMMNLWR